MRNDPSSTTILVVDDNPATLYSTSRVLRGAGFSVLEAATGIEAVNLASQGVDLVVLDINLPDFDGYEVCRRIREKEITTRIPVVHLSASFVQDSDKVHGLEVGADGYLTHPVEPPVLVATVNAFLRARQAEHEMRVSEAKFKAVFENAINGLSLVSNDSIFLDVNPAMCRLLQRNREAIIGHRTSEFIPPDWRERGDAIIQELEQSGTWRGILPLVRADGQLVHLEWSMSIHSFPGVRLSIVSDITDRVRSEREREMLLESERAARSESEKANRLKDDFLATLSHELRTPLNAILGWSQLLKSGQLSPADVADGIDTIERNARIQVQMISDLLDVSRITSGKIRLDVQSVDPAALVDTAVGTAMPAAEAKNIRISKVLDSDAGPVSGDPSRLQQVIWNLVNNAVKFTPKGGKIQIRLQRIDSHVEIAVADSGQGIRPDLLPFVFERFRQGDASASREHGGLGLGLAIAKQLIEMHGGSIQAESEGEGKGSTFSITLPISPFRSPTSSVSAIQISDPGASRMASSRLDGIRVLVVDDDADARKLMKRVLDESGADSRISANADEALSTIEDFHPQLLVSDLGMPGQDGFELIRQVRLRGYTFQTLPAVALTAFARSEDRQRALLAGFQVHVTKPVDPAELTAVIATLVGRTGADS